MNVEIKATLLIAALILVCSSLFKNILTEIFFLENTSQLIDMDGDKFIENHHLF
jgi:hypothetical protein